jgi:hypothetical protein
MSGDRMMAPEAAGTVESPFSAVSWGAIFAGGLTAAAITLILVLVGAGVGFASMSPWQGEGAAASTVVIGSVVWLIVVQWMSSGLGGYVAGRLRANWTGIRRDEVLFRDTAHGLLAWAFATVVGLALASSALGTAVTAGARGVAAVAEGAASVSSSALNPVSQYQLDTLLRPASPGAAQPAPLPDVAPEVGRVLAHGIASGEVPPDDRAYLARIVATRAGISEEEARRRVDQAVTAAQAAAAEAKQAAETARKAAMKLSLFGALALIIGAFIASAAAALGGLQRDEV